MAAYLVGAYRNASGVSFDPKAKAVNVASASGKAGASGAGPLSPSAYAREVAALRASGRQVEGSREYQALQARRTAYRG
jgi:hypothetical protein